MSQESQTTATNAAAGELRTAAATARQIAAEREAAHNTSQEPATDAATADAQPLPLSPSRHLLRLIVDALQLPDPARTPQDQMAYLAMVSRRAMLVLQACQQALAGPSEGVVLFAARDLFDGVSNTPPVTYRHARTGPRASA